MSYAFGPWKVRELRAVPTPRRVQSTLKLALVWGSAMAGLAVAPLASATTIDFSSSSGGWTVSGAGVTNATPFILGSGALSLSDNGRRTGTFVPAPVLQLSTVSGLLPSLFLTVERH